MPCPQFPKEEPAEKTPQCRRQEEKACPSKWPESLDAVYEHIIEYAKKFADCKTCIIIWSIVLALLILFWWIKYFRAQRAAFCSCSIQFCGATDAGDSGQYVRNAVRKLGVVIFTKDGCPHCAQAKGIFDKMRIPFDEYDLSLRFDGPEMLDVLEDLTGSRTVPRVFINGECIGGASETEALYRSGQLRSLSNVNSSFKSAYD